MTPQEKYAQKRLEAETLIRQHAPERLQGSLIKLLRPAIALHPTRCDDSQIPVGASKFGGAPDVPLGFEWPTWNGKPLGFLAQINLEEVAPFDLEGLLPKAGLLSFFASFDEEDPLIGELDQWGGWKVFFHQKQEWQRAEVPPDSHWIVELFSQRVRVEAAYTLEEWSIADLSEFSEEQWSDFQWEVLEKPPHRMMDEPYAPQFNPLEGAVWLNSQNQETPTRSQDWHLLLQLDTEQDGFFADIHGLGWLYFMIHRDDLRARDFSRVWFNEQCT